MADITCGGCGYFNFECSKKGFDKHQVESGHTGTSFKDGNTCARCVTIIAGNRDIRRAHNRVCNWKELGAIKLRPVKQQPDVGAIRDNVLTTPHIIKCDKCNATFGSDPSLKNHIRERHNDFACKQCTKPAYKTQWNLDKHIKDVHVTPHLLAERENLLKQNEMLQEQNSLIPQLLVELELRDKRLNFIRDLGDITTVKIENISIDLTGDL